VDLNKRANTKPTGKSEPQFYDRIGRVLSENALLIYRAGKIVPSARPGWWTRVAVTCQAAINHLVPIGYQDESGLHYGGVPVSNIAKLQGHSGPPRPHPKIRLISPIWAISLCSALWESAWMIEKSKLPKRSRGLDKKSKKERPSQTTIFRYERGKETSSPPRSKSGK
jgi:hypothetical protein